MMNLIKFYQEVLKKCSKRFQQILIFSARTLIKLYQVFFSQFLGGSCRFYPTCSSYAEEVIRQQPIFKAFGLIFRRLMKCHPFGASGFDPVPRTKDRA